MSYQTRQRDQDPYYPEYGEQGPEPLLVLTRRRALWIGGGVAVALLVVCACCILVAGAFFIGRETAQPAAPDEESVPTAEATEAASEAPQALIAGPAEAQVGQPVEFDGSSSQAGSNPIARYDWQFGDGAPGEGAKVSHAYAAPGSYQVTLTVSDDQGLSTTSAPHSIVVKGAEVTQAPAPVINAFSVSPAEIAPGDCAQLSWAVSADAARVLILRDGVPLLDNAGATGQQPDCPPQAGSYVYRLEASNATGQAAAQEQSLTVAEGGAVPPQDALAGTGWLLVAIEANQAPLPGTPISLVFGADGTVSGNSGCNDYSGTYTVEGNSLSIGPLSTAGAVCGDDIDSQEQDYLMLLGTAATFQVTGPQLSMADVTGAEVLRFNSAQ